MPEEAPQQSVPLTETIAEQQAPEISCSLAIFSMNSVEIGKITATESAVVVDFTESAGLKRMDMPHEQIKAANVTRVGRIGLDSYVVRVYISTVLAAKLRQELPEVKLLNAFGAEMPSSAFATITGEYAEFFINSKDVFGQVPVTRKFMDIVNRTSPERLRLPE